MVGAAAQHAGTPPDPIGTRGIRVWLSRDLPPAQGSGIKSAPSLLMSRRTPMRNLIGPGKHFRIFRAVEPVTGFEHADLSARIRQHMGGNTTTGTGADDDNVICFRGSLHLGHEILF